MKILLHPRRAGVPLLPIPVFGRAAKGLWDLELAEHATAQRFDTAAAFERRSKKFKAEEVADLALQLARARRTK